MEDFPSCHLFSNAYKSVVNVSCFEFSDNINTYWFVLIIIMLLNVMVACLALKLADLYRKNYPYSMFDDSYNEKEIKFHPNKSKGRSNRLPIESHKYD